MNSFEEENEHLSPEQAWCSECAGPVDVDDSGCCVTCRDDGYPGIVSNVVIETVPDESPRSIECGMCGADPGEHCYPGPDGSGYNHAERVEAHEREYGVVAARRYA